MSTSSTTLEFHVFIDPPEHGRDDAPSALARARAALVAFHGRLQPRLRQATWHRDPLTFWLWDPSDGTSRRGSRWPAAQRRAAEAHVWGCMNVGESLDDEWFVVALLMQLSAEQRDASVTVADDDGELLLIESAYAIPRWLTPERATNRIFLRHGDLHIVPRHAVSGATCNTDTPLDLADGLRALRKSSPRETRCAAATMAIRARTGPLLGVDGAACGPPRHGARCVLPQPVAAMLAAEPALAAAAAAAFAERDGATMRAASRMAHCSPRAHPCVWAHVVLGRTAYAQLVTSRLSVPPTAGFPLPPATHTKHRPASLGARVAFGMELLLCLATAPEPNEAGAAEETAAAAAAEGCVDGAPTAVGGAVWESFDAELHARGYYRGELPSSTLYQALRVQAAAALAAEAPRAPARTMTWLQAQARRAHALLRECKRKGAEGAAVDAGSSGDAAYGLPAGDGGWLPADESDAWMGLTEEALEDALRSRAAGEPEAAAAAMAAAATAAPAPSRARDSAGAASEEAAARQAHELRQVARSVSDFVMASAGPDGAEFPTAASAPVELDADRFLEALEKALGAKGLGAGGESGEASAGLEEEEEKEEEEEEEEDDEGEEEEEEEEGEEGTGDAGGTLTELMAAMDLELRERQKTSDFELVQEGATDGDSPAREGEPGRPAATSESEDTRPVDLDLNLVKNLLASYSAQQGFSGPVSNLLGSLGLTLPEDADSATQRAGVIGA